MSVWVYVSGEDIRVFSSRQKATAWIKKHDPEGVAVQCMVDDSAPLK